MLSQGVVVVVVVVLSGGVEWVKRAV